MRKFHDDPLGGHLGCYKTKKKVQQKYYWPKMSSYVTNYIRRCEACQLNKHPNKTNKAPLGNSKDPKKPWEMIAIDFLGPYPTSNSGNEYI